MINSTGTGRPISRRCDSEISVPYLKAFRKIKYPKCQRNQINLLYKSRFCNNSSSKC